MSESLEDTVPERELRSQLDFPRGAGPVTTPQHRAQLTWFKKQHPAWSRQIPGKRHPACRATDATLTPLTLC
ncbi:hypothetical protein Y1Q_0004463 [Alligator mississippiensis]|uniref:Uncharacterized protein n=1 Tax=Alligator mississippiensis TaxID=8496 RepID=A0A151NTQ6_ALLMI|nr:hypothetical protein Y1Q_0004463 [Alligator mississippiensis]